MSVGASEFQFPSNGKARVNATADNTVAKSPKVVFQFPSNGKARVNQEALAATKENICGGKVSIPFKREGTCERLTNFLPEKFCASFNSLQTGRHV